MADLLKITRLIKAQQSGTLSENEKEELDAWVRESPKNKEVVDKGFRPEELAYHLEILFGVKEESTREKLWRRLEQLGPHQFSIGTTPSSNPQDTSSVGRPPRAPWPLWLKITVPAAGILISLSIWQSRQSGHKEQSQTPVAQATGPTITYGKNIIHLDSLPDKDTVFHMGKLEVARTDKKHIACHFTGYRKDDDTEKRYLTLFVPRTTDTTGFQVSLPYENRAVLYSGTLSLSLSDPSDTAQTKIGLNGNASFDVSHNANKPFLVQTPFSLTTALGTYFSIIADTRNNVDSIFLYTGKLKINHGKTIRTINQGHMALISPSSDSIKIDTVIKMRKELPWRPDVFDFSNQGLYAAMQQIKNRYRMKDVKFGPGIDTTTLGKLSGLIYKDQPLPQLLNLLTKININNIHFYATKDSVIHADIR